MAARLDGRSCGTCPGTTGTRSTTTCRRGIARNRGRWIAHLDEATDERVATLTELLRSPVSFRPAPAAAPGWRFRLTLEQPDPICLFTMFPPRRDAVGLFDADTPSLAVLEGGRMHCLGHPSCGDRLEALLCAPAPLELSDLTKRVTPS